MLHCRGRLSSLDRAKGRSACTTPGADPGSLLGCQQPRWTSHSPISLAMSSRQGAFPLPACHLTGELAPLAVSHATNKHESSKTARYAASLIAESRPVMGGCERARAGLAPILLATSTAIVQGAETLQLASLPWPCLEFYWEIKCHCQLPQRSIIRIEGFLWHACRNMAMEPGEPGLYPTDCQLLADVQISAPAPEWSWLAPQSSLSRHPPTGPEGQQHMKVMLKARLWAKLSW